MSKKKAEPGNPALLPHPPGEGEEACPVCELAGAPNALVLLTKTAQLYDPETAVPDQRLNRLCVACGYHLDG